MGKHPFYAGLALLTLIVIEGLTLAFWPTEWRIKNNGICPQLATEVREGYSGPLSSRYFTVSLHIADPTIWPGHQ